MQPRRTLAVDSIRLSDPLLWAGPLEEREGDMPCRFTPGGAAR